MPFIFRTNPQISVVLKICTRNKMIETNSSFISTEGEIPAFIILAQYNSRVNTHDAINWAQFSTKCIGRSAHVRIAAD